MGSLVHHFTVSGCEKAQWVDVRLLHPVDNRVQNIVSKWIIKTCFFGVSVSYVHSSWIVICLTNSENAEGFSRPVATAEERLHRPTESSMLQVHCTAGPWRFCLSLQVIRSPDNLNVLTFHVPCRTPSDDLKLTAAGGEKKERNERRKEEGNEKERNEGRKKEKEMNK